MREIEELIRELSGKDTNAGCQAMGLLENQSDQSDGVYAYMDEFVSLLANKNSYARKRGFTLIAANAKWDLARKIDQSIEKILALITDEKPITARQCIKKLPLLVRYKPELKERICAALRTADLSAYKDSMRPLIDADIQWALKSIQDNLELS